MDMSADLLDLVPDGWKRDVFRDVAKLAEETGEVAQAVIKNTSYTDADIAEELSDVIAVCCVIALRKGIDLEQACVDKHKKRIEKRINWSFGGERPADWKPRIKI
jgi:NTP pyrophosphatase (non-canonical NTP hydrolase)